MKLVENRTWYAAATLVAWLFALFVFDRLALGYVASTGVDQSPWLTWGWRALMVAGTLAGGILYFATWKRSRSNEKAQRRSIDIFRHSPIPTITRLGDDAVLYTNDAFEETFGHTLSELRAADNGQPFGPWVKILLPDGNNLENIMTLWDSQKAKSVEGATESLEISVTCKNGDVRTVLLSFVMFDSKTGSEWMALLMDVTEQRKEELQRQLYAQIFQNLQEAIIVADTQERVIDVNPAYSAIVGIPREEVIGQKMPRMQSSDQDEAFFETMSRSLEEKGSWRGKYLSRRNNGELMERDMSVSTVYNDDGEHCYYVSVFSDVTETTRQTRELELIRNYDLLTQLPNRALFTDRFSQAAARARRNDTSLAICVFDLDDFKLINKQYGEDLADQLLVAVANRISMSIREEDTLSRFSGDEFVLLLCDINNADVCVQTIKRIQENLRYPYDIAGNSIHVSASVGITLYPEDDDDLDILLRHADQAMYQAKLTSRSNYCLFNAENDRRVVERHDRQRDIESALRNEEFQLYYQPKVNMTTGEVFGAEALIRWHHPEQGVLPPPAFLPDIEGCAVEVDMGHWVMCEALRQMAQWRTAGIDLQVSINISSYHLQSGCFYSQLKEALAQYPDMTPGSLQIEVLESSTLADIASVSEVVAACHDELGVSIALDDFGTGYSSLTHIKELNADTIKIDQSFVRDMLEDPNDYAIADGVIRLADAFNRRVVAEGVEETEHGLMLMIMGCEYAQGYCIARPMPADDMVTWLADYTPNKRWTSFPYGSLSASESKLMIFRMSFRHWVDMVENALVHSDSALHSNRHYEAQGPTDSHCGVWLAHERRGNVFEPDWIDKIEESYQRLFRMANDAKANSGATATECETRAAAFRRASKDLLDLLDSPNAAALTDIAVG